MGATVERAGEMVNISGPEEIMDGDILHRGNFTQLMPDTPIMVGKSITIMRGNFTNVLKQPTWDIRGGNFSFLNRCSNREENAKFVNAGLRQCAVECEHMMSREEIWVGGVLYDIVREYSDIGGRG